MLKMGFVILRLHLDIKFDQKIIQPCPADAEPTAGTTLFASESEHKIAITVLAERKSYIHKLHVAESPFMGIFKCFPHGQYAGRLQCVCLSHSSRKPDKGIVSGVYSDVTTDNFFFVFYYEYFCLFAFDKHAVHMAEKVIGREVSPYP